jgi:hypothetical protein
MKHRSSLREHLCGPPPKRILALDGGGVRALVALGFLERIEVLLRDAYGGDEAFRLADHFDLIGGTSSGALVATGLALGMSVAEIIEVSQRLAHHAFTDPGWFGGMLSPKYESEALLDQLRHVVGDETLGSDQLRTGLAIVAKRMDTGSPWVFHNNPQGKFYRPEGNDGSVANADIPLHEILRASTAAPTYFEPERIAIAPGVEGLFVDGGVSPFNNPALLLFLMVTTPAYGYSWPVGADRLSIINVGTGIGGRLDSADALGDMPSAMLAAVSLESIITDCSWQAQAVLQWLGVCAEPWEIDGEAGEFACVDSLPAKLLRYQRYNLLFEQGWLGRELGVHMDPDELEQLARLDRPESADHLLRMARQAAQRQVDISHLNEASSS